MINDMTFEDVCGYVHVTFVRKQKIAPGGMQAPFADGRPAGSALYFMLTPEEPVKLHRIRNDQLYHYYLGDPIEVLMLLEDGIDRVSHRRPRYPQRTQGAAPYPGRHVPHGTRVRRTTLVSWRIDRVARG